MVDSVKRLRSLMRQHGLTNADVADLAMVSVKTVESWLASSNSASRRRMPARNIHLIEARLWKFLEKRGEEE